MHSVNAVLQDFYLSGNRAIPDLKPSNSQQQKASNMAHFELAGPTAPARSKSLVAHASERSVEDRALDADRRPVELLAFLGITRGWRVADLGAGNGYTTELLQRAVGKDGVVYGQNSKAWLGEYPEADWNARLAKPVMKGVIRIDGECDAPLPADAASLDAVTMVLFYHDTVRLSVDRGAMNNAIFAALKPGGVYLIVDHSARPGDGAKVTHAYHRIEESVVRAEVRAAGFKLDGEADFLRNPADTRDWDVSPSASRAQRGSSDRFVLRFRKP
jgi:predicted methyltransferase